jgi:hypothetical protein
MSIEHRELTAARATMTEEFLGVATCLKSLTENNEECHIKYEKTKS